MSSGYMAEQIGLYSVVVGIALLLSGIGFIIADDYRPPVSTNERAEQ